MAKRDSMQREWKRLQRREQRALAPRKENIVQQKLQPLKDKVSEAVPEKALAMTEAAFAKGFALVFEQGAPVIERTFSQEKRRAAHYAGSALMADGAAREAIRTMDRSARRSVWANKALTTAEGGVLGILGIGLPDIPVYIGVLLKTVYEIALSYGYRYDNDEERKFILAVIGMAAAEDEERQRYAARADKLGMLIDDGQPTPVAKDALIDEAARLLTLRLVGAKFVQGLPVVGVVGAVTNYAFLADLSKASEIKYKKRYLRRVQREQV